MVNNSLDSIGPDPIETLINMAVASARTGDYSSAARHLNLLLQELEPHLSRMSPGTLHDIGYSMETLFAMQKMKNWVALADILEFELLPLWRSR